MSAAEDFAALLVDRAEIARHARLIHEQAAHACRGVEAPGVLQVSTLDVRSSGLVVLGRYAIGEHDRMAREAEAAARRGLNVYVEGRTVRANLPLGRRGEKSDTVLVFALVVDNDAYKGKAPPVPGTPSLLVESSPGSNHAWYALDRALTQAEAETIGAKMKAAGSDATGVPTQPYRVAGTPNYPTREKRKLGRVEVPTHILAVSDVRHTPETLAPLWPSGQHKGAAAAEQSSDEVDDVAVLLSLCSAKRRADLAQETPTGERSEHFHKVTGWLKGDGFTIDQAQILWEEHPLGAASKWINDKDRLRTELERSWGKVTDRPRRPRGTGSNDIITEDNAAMMFAERFFGLLRFDHELGAWFEWDGAHWKRVVTGVAFSWARKLARELAQDADPRIRFVAGKAGFAASVEKFARADEAFAVTADAWDRDPWLLGTPAGTVDLRTGALREPDPAEGITKQTAVAPAAQAACPRWLAFLDEATGGDQPMVGFLKQWAGYCLTGVTSEHALLFAHGPGGNGKSVFLNTLSRILGSYAATAAMETFVSAKFGSHPTDLAMLRGARLVTASETEEGRAWAEARIKAITGGDPITARFMRQDFFTFLPQFKLTLVGNHKPILRNVDDAARRRFNIVPFTRTPAVVDRQLEEKLTDELPGILRWMIDGCLDWQTHGLVRPATVVAETDAYFAEQDTFSHWFEDCCQVGNPVAFTPTRDLFASWSAFARHRGEEAGNERTFAAQMARKGLTVFKTNRGRGYRGVALAPEELTL